MRGGGWLSQGFSKFPKSQYQVALQVLAGSCFSGLRRCGLRQCKLGRDGYYRKQPKLEARWYFQTLHCWPLYAKSCWWISFPKTAIPCLVYFLPQETEREKKKHTHTHTYIFVGWLTINKVWTFLVYISGQELREIDAVAFTWWVKFLRRMPTRVCNVISEQGGQI